MNHPEFTRQGILFVISAPSGTGKSTLCRSLRSTPDFIYSISCTTRPARPGEFDGEDYHFLTVDDFMHRVQQGEMLEHAKVHDNYYGTLKQTVRDALLDGTDVLMDIDIQGADQIRAAEDGVIRESLVDVFYLPPTLHELEMRLRKRGTETEEQVLMRLATGREEMNRWSDYKYTLVSGSMEEDLIKFRAIMRAERYLSRRIRFSGQWV